MEKFIEFIKWNWKKIILGIGIICMAIPWAIHFFAKLINSPLSADGIIAYLIGVIGAIATLTIALVSVWQTQKANEISNVLLDMQKQELLPVLQLDGFVGITRDNLRAEIISVENNISVHEIRLDDNEVVLGYTVNVVDENFDKKKAIYHRAYECTFEYNGKFITNQLNIKSIEFGRDKLKKVFYINKDIDISFTKGQKVKVFLFVIGNESFIDEHSSTYDIIASANMTIRMTLKTIVGTKFKETINIRKHLIKEPEKCFETEFVEGLVSVAYNIDEVGNGMEERNLEKDKDSVKTIRKNMLKMYNEASKKGLLYPSLKEKLKKHLDGDIDRLKTYKLIAENYNYLSMNLNTSAVIIALMAFIFSDIYPMEKILQNPGVFATCLAILLIIPVIVVLAIIMDKREKKFSCIAKILNDLEDMED